MSAFTRFVSLGLRDADRRIGDALTPRPLEPIDKYLRTSMIVTAIDRVTERLSVWWSSSRVYEVSASMMARVPDDSRRYQAIGSLLLIAVATNIALTMINGPRPGWFWMVIPGMVIAFAALLFAGSRR